MASGAGLNQGLYVLLDNLSSSTPTVSSPTAAYGSIGVNDSGGQCLEMRGYTKWVIMLEQLTSTALTTINLSVYYTISPLARLTWEAATTYGYTPVPNAQPFQPYPNQPAQLRNALTKPTFIPGITNATGYFPGIPPWAWNLADPQAQTGSNMANPITSSAPTCVFNYPIEAVRVCVTTGLGAGTARVILKVVP